MQGLFPGPSGRGQATGLTDGAKRVRALASVSGGLRAWSACSGLPRRFAPVTSVRDETEAACVRTRVRGREKGNGEGEWKR